jgi:hypothetical protein
MYIFNNKSILPWPKKKLSAALHFYTTYYTVLKKQNIPEDAA